MRDSRKNRRFFLTDSTSGVIEFAKSARNDEMSPCVIMESDLNGGGPVARPVMVYPIYFFVKAEKMADGDAASIAKNLAIKHARAFLAWLKEKRDEEVEENIDGDFSRINLDDYIDYLTVGPLENGWYAILVQIEREEPLNLCVDEDLYDLECECEEEEEEEEEGEG